MSNLNAQNGNNRVFYNAETETVTGDIIYCTPPPPYSIIPTVTQSVPQVNTIIVQPPLKLKPTAYICTACHKRIITKVKYVNTRKTHLIAGFIGGFTFWCLLCCLAAIPYMLPTFKKAVHYCPNCETFLGSYSL